MFSLVYITIIIKLIIPSQSQCGDCFEDHYPTPGCSHEECEGIVCGMDSFCCDAGWDYICVDIALYAEIGCIDLPCAYNMTRDPTNDPTIDPTSDPTIDPTNDPTIDPTRDPTIDPTVDPTNDPTIDPTRDPTKDPTTDPTADPIESIDSSDSSEDCCRCPAEPCIGQPQTQTQSNSGSSSYDANENALVVEMKNDGENYNEKKSNKIKSTYYQLDQSQVWMLWIMFGILVISVGFNITVAVYCHCYKTTMSIQEYNDEVGTV